MKTVGIFRAGAYGDLMQASSVIKALKDQGYHTTLICAPPADVIIRHDPNIDQIIEHDTSIPFEGLKDYWKELSQVFDKWVNLSGSVEDVWLQLPGSPTYDWPVATRHKYFNRNYLRTQHEIAGVPYYPQIKFYPTPEERAWAYDQRLKYKAKKILCWCIAGSGIHKISPHINNFIANVLKLDNVEVVLLGTPQQRALASGLEGIDRVHFATDWDIRKAYTFVQNYCDILVGPETGIMSAMSGELFKKIVLLSHSTKENLTEDWIQTTSISANLKGKDCCLHRLADTIDESNKVIYNDGKFAWHTSLCQSMIDPTEIWNAALPVLKN